MITSAWSEIQAVNELIEPVVVNDEQPAVANQNYVSRRLYFKLFEYSILER